MRAMFSLLGLVLVLAVVAVLVKQQSRSMVELSTAESMLVIHTPAQGRAAQEQIQRELDKAMSQARSQMEAADQ